MTRWAGFAWRSHALDFLLANNTQRRCSRSTWQMINRMTFLVSFQTRRVNPQLGLRFLSSHLHFLHPQLHLLQVPFRQFRQSLLQLRHCYFTSCHYYFTSCHYCFTSCHYNVALYAKVPIVLPECLPTCHLLSCRPCITGQSLSNGEIQRFS